MCGCRRTSKVGPDGMPEDAVRPYLMDLGSTNGTYINNERLEAQRFYELMEKVTFWHSQGTGIVIPGFA